MEKIIGNICVGMKETLRAAAEDKLQKIILALDADGIFRARIRTAAEKHHIPVETVLHAATLGKQVGIEVKAGVIGIFKP